MNYNDFYLEGPEWVGDVTREGVEAIDGRIPLYSGLFICPNPENKTEENDPENHGLIPEELGSCHPGIYGKRCCRNLPVYPRAHDGSSLGGL
jgi:hypothetical protein